MALAFALFAHSWGTEEREDHQERASFDNSYTKAALLSNSVQSVSVKFALFHRHISWNSKQARPVTGLLSRVIPFLTGPNQGLVLLPLKRSEASNCPTILLCCAGVHPQSHMRTGLWEESDLDERWSEALSECYKRSQLSIVSFITQRLSSNGSRDVKG